MKQRAWATFFLLVLSVATLSVASAAEVIVYKSPTCGCCSQWVDHLRANGFDVKTREVQDVTPYKTRHGVPSELASCHTTLVEGYVIEGHVPARDIKRLLSERPKVTGLAVPGMPLGSPGMESDTKQAYNVIAFDKAGNKAVYARY